MRTDEPKFVSDYIMQDICYSQWPEWGTLRLRKTWGWGLLEEWSNSLGSSDIVQLGLEVKPPEAKQASLKHGEAIRVQ